MRRALSSAALRAALLAAALAAALPALAQAPRPPARTMAEIVAAAQPSEWRTLDPANTVYMDLPQGRVIIELAPHMAPNAVAQIKALVQQGYFNGLSINRSQENYVVQWGDPAEGAARRPFPGKETLEAEFDRPARGLAISKLADPDGYAPEVGWSRGFPVARNAKINRVWMAHCYGAVGVGRDNASNSGNGGELYAVIGHAPRNLDRNVTLVGRVVQGMSLLSTLQRGTGNLGFYESPGERVPLLQVRLASDVAEAERTNLQALRTNTPSFKALIEARRNRRDAWYKVQAGHIDLCNVPLPVRAAPAPISATR